MSININEWNSFAYERKTTACINIATYTRIEPIGKMYYIITDSIHMGVCHSSKAKQHYIANLEKKDNQICVTTIRYLSFSIQGETIPICSVATTHILHYVSTCIKKS